MGNRKTIVYVRHFLFGASIALGAIVTGLPSYALANPLACKFQQRTEDFYFRHLPKEIVGWVNCGSSPTPAKDELNVLYVARIASTEPKTLLEWFRGYEKVMVPAMLSSKIVEKSATAATKTPATPSETWLEIESKREIGTMTHYIFTAHAADGSIYAFVYTDNTEHAREIRARVTSLRQVLVKPSYISAIASELP
jgi:hypothetical protein